MSCRIGSTEVGHPVASSIRFREWHEDVNVLVVVVGSGGGGVGGEASAAAAAVVVGRLGCVPNE